MAGFEKDTVGGFNSTIERQKKLQKEKGGTVYVSTVLFNTYTEVVHDRVPLEKVEPLTEDSYRVGGCTALLDAVGGAIKHIGNIHKYARAEDVPEHTMVIITTDGEENSSRKYTKADVKASIKRQSEEYGWEFIFLAANIDAVSAAGGIGIHSERAVNYMQDSDGVEATYDAMSEAITALRCKQSLDSAQWRRRLDKN